MKKHIVRGILALGLLAAPAVLAGTASADQATGYQGTQGTTQKMEGAAHDAQNRINEQMPRKDTDWGWLGLIGLGGLAGLLRRPTEDTTVKQRGSYRTGEPIGSR
jgi:MYXO-CTERM domain-containing protein